jgi:hypothetical protein
MLHAASRSYVDSATRCARRRCADSDKRVAAKTFRTGKRGGVDWKWAVKRAPDAIIAFPFALTGCFEKAVEFEMLPPPHAPNTTRIINFLHNMVHTLISAVPPAAGAPKVSAHIFSKSRPCGGLPPPYRDGRQSELDPGLSTDWSVWSYGQLRMPTHIVLPPTA